MSPWPFNVIRVASSLLTLFLLSGVAWFPRSVRAQPVSEESQFDFQTQITPVLREYCYACHGPDQQTKGIGLHQYSNQAEILKDRKTWEKVLEKIKFGQMPPADEPRPSDQQRRQLVAWLESMLLDVDCSLARDPGRVTIRRLNRVEYNNTIRDLIGIDLQPADEFPTDDVGEGFDNIGDVLSLSPLLLEKYINAAERIASEAIVTLDPAMTKPRRRQNNQLHAHGGVQQRDNGDFFMYSRATVEAQFEFSRTGTYLLRAIAGAQQAGPEPAKLEFRLDGEQVDVVTIQATVGDPQPYEVRIAVQGGNRKFSASFINDYYRPDDPDPANRDRNMVVRALEVAGPVDVDPGALPDSHQRLVVARPDDGKSVAAAAQENLQPLLARAFRRPVEGDEVGPYVRLVELAVGKGGSFERGMQVAVSAILISPSFLFRIEQDPSPADANPIRILNNYELATRLSYFLWSSMPDDELFQLARQGQLHQQEVLRQQVHRMIADEKSSALVENFAGQWLNLRNLSDVTPDPDQFGAFDDNLRESMRRETLLLFESVMREDRSVLDILNADYTYVNEQLASHYGIPEVVGADFRKVQLSGHPRRGVLTHASILTLTSNPTRTSPVKRGKWILENLLGTPPPDPPVDVPELAETQKAAPGLSLKEQLKLHRQDHSCAVCHLEMDSLGLGLENFDALGRWRERDGDLPIQPSGGLPGGETFSGPTELIELLVQRKIQYSRTLARKMLTYALGRGIEFYDRCALDIIVESMAANDYRFSVLVSEVVFSEPFRMRRGEEGIQ